MISKRMLYIMPLIVWSAWSMNFFAGVFVVLMTRCMKATYPVCVKDKVIKDCWDDDK